MSTGNASVAVSTVVDTVKKVMQFGIFVFLEPQEINLWDNLQVSKCDGDCIFLWELFSFYENFPSPLDPEVFLEIFLPETPPMFLTDLHWSIICSFTKKACKSAIKRDSKIFSKLPKE